MNKYTFIVIWHHPDYENEEQVFTLEGEITPTIARQMGEAVLNRRQQRGWSYDFEMKPKLKILNKGK